MTLRLQDILAKLGAGEALETLSPHWDESEARFPDSTPRFLTAEGVTFARGYVGLPAGLDAPLLETARRVWESPDLAHLAWHCNRLLFDCLDYEGPGFRQWPKLDVALGESADVFYLLVALDVVPRARAAHRTRDIPEAISRASCGDFEEVTRRHAEHSGGRLGVDMRAIYWLRHYTAGNLYRLGRLEYMVRPFGGRVHVYRNCETRQVVALAGAGTVFNAQGFIDADPEATESGWTARFIEESDAVTGCPISPAGVGVREELRLPSDTWKKVLGPGDPVLDTHIPAGGGMNLERCEDTMRRALEFFPRYFPERPFVGFGCGSWILNPELEQIYSPTSNMVLWQRELYLYPLPSGGNSGLYFVFARDDVDPATAPRDTSLRRAILDHLAVGGRMRAGGMFLLTEDFEQFGTQLYRSTWPPRV